MDRFKLNHISAFQIYQILKYGSSLLINIALAKSYLSLIELGVFESVIFYSSFISFFWINGISQAIMTQASNQKDTSKAKYFAAFILFFLISVVAVAILLLVNEINYLKLINLKDNAYTLFIIYSIFNPTTFLIDFILLLEKKIKELTAFGIITFIVPVLMISLPAFLGYPLFWCLIGLLMWTLIKFIYLFNLILKYSEFKISKNDIFKLLQFSLPLIITAFLAGSASYIDSIIININFDNATFAIFRYGAREFPLFLLIANAFGTSMIPQFTNEEALNQNLEEIKSKSRRMIQFLFPIAIILLLFSQYLFTWVFSKGFYESYRIFDIYLLLIISRFVFPQTILIGLKKNMLTLQIAFFELIVNLVSSLILLQYFGFMGVAYGTIIAYIFEKTLLALTLKRKNKIKPQRYIPFKELIIYSTILVGLYLIKNLIY